ncbi:hypothetical protein Y032_0467g1990 [Ancylostoma ceylanicum]|uniref:Nuclear receptor domain-containing protein n=1 Tax=Ancylostoma ceylanicum TaxID=53326 RepID=A0A016WY97_9BILA|nr:hypothetical protein Y032_0467g1990 [Ancylostoma ceylanicum]
MLVQEFRTILVHDKSLTHLQILAFVKHEFFYQAPPEELFYPQPECMDWPTRSPSPCRQCTICGAPSNGYHFNAPSCSACAAFFRQIFSFRLWLIQLYNLKFSI